MSETASTNSFRHIARVTSIFGGVQVLTILVGMIRNKCVAVWLGTEGAGLLGLLVGTLALVASVTDLGLGPSVVREIAVAHSAQQPQRLADQIQIARRWMWLSGLCGTLATLALAPWLSRWAVGDERHRWHFVAASAVLLLGQLSLSRVATLQGLQRLGDVARCNVAGAAIGLAASIPLYIAFGIEGIVPAMLATAVVNWLVAERTFRRADLPRSDLGWTETWGHGKVLVMVGTGFALNGVLSNAAPYIIRVDVSSHGSIAEVGLYTAGFGVLNQYVGMLFNAMVTDYFPRLTASIQRREDWQSAVNHQAMFSLLVLGPFLVAFVVAVPMAIQLLFSSKFMPATSMMRWAALGILFKAISWPIGYLPVPFGQSRTFVVNELGGHVAMVTASIVGYRLWGLSGLGMGYAAAYLWYFLQTAILARVRYGFCFERAVALVALLQAGLILAVLTALCTLPDAIAWAVGALAFAATSWVSVRKLNKELQLVARGRDWLTRRLR
jgi:O-antigen/teichoic acid export membrane protein